jgi:hypothetical protein
MQASLVLEDRDKLVIHREGFSVIDHRSKSIEKVLINAPGGAQDLGYFQHRVYFFPVAEVNIVAPFRIIGVDGISKPGK